MSIPVDIQVGSVEELPKDAPEGALAAVDMSTLPPQPDAANGGGGLGRGMLQAAIPSFQPDINQAWVLLGQKVQYEYQLQTEMLRRAEEANGLHDATLAMTRTILRLQTELAQARVDHATSQEDGLRAHENAIAVNQRLSAELEATRNERDELRDKLANLKLRKQNSKLRKEPEV